MAVFQISKIQVRRGKKAVSGMPQLASGELAWAIDTQELYIGNGAISEGSPFVGNTKVLTEKDNIFTLAEQYSYKPLSASIFTGIGVDIGRSLQSRLDEGQVNAKSFGIEAEEGPVPLKDQTELIQNAIWSLYSDGFTMLNKVVLEFDPGYYKISGTVYLPSNVSIQGSGIGKTIFYYEKGGLNYRTTFTITGTSTGSNSAGTYIDIPVVTVTGTGSGATVRITKGGDLPYSGNASVTVINSGKGYASGDQVKIPGTVFGAGSVSPDNDMLITLVNNEVLATAYPSFGTNTIFEFVNRSSSRDTRNPSPTSTTNQPSNVKLSDFSVSVNRVNSTRVFAIDDLTNSQFVNIDAVSEDRTGLVVSVFSPTADDQLNSAVSLTATSSVLTCKENSFTNVKARGFNYAIFSSTDIINNIFTNCVFEDLYKGIGLGIGASLGANGPRKNTIENSLFNRILQEGLLVEKGYGNRSKGNTFINVGTNLSGIDDAIFPVINFISVGNSSFNDNFDRADPYSSLNLSRTNFTKPYAPEVAGRANYQEIMPAELTLAYTTVPEQAFKIPVNNVNNIEINYVFKSTAFNQTKKGTLHIVVDLLLNRVQLVDEFEYIGTTGQDNRIQFTASIASNAGSGSTVIKSLIIFYTNLNVSDTNTFTYTYKVLS
jgi:hypothetical protein